MFCKTSLYKQTNIYTKTMIKNPQSCVLKCFINEHLFLLKDFKENSMRNNVEVS